MSRWKLSGIDATAWRISSCWTARSTTRNGLLYLRTGWTHIARIPRAVQNYCDRHVLGDVPREIKDFTGYYGARRQRLRNRIAGLVNSV